MGYWYKLYCRVVKPNIPQVPLLVLSEHAEEADSPVRETVDVSDTRSRRMRGVREPTDLALDGSSCCNTNKEMTFKLFACPFLFSLLLKGIRV